MWVVFVRNPATNMGIRLPAPLYLADASDTTPSLAVDAEATNNPTAVMKKNIQSHAPGTRSSSAAFRSPEPGSGRQRSGAMSRSFT